MPRGCLRVNISENLCPLAADVNSLGRKETACHHCLLPMLTFASVCNRFVSGLTLLAVPSALPRARGEASGICRFALLIKEASYGDSLRC